MDDKQTVERLLRSMECIRGWCAAAVAAALECVRIEADAAIRYESEVRK